MTEITAQLSTALADRYQITSHLGEGGMATVYLAHDVKHDRKVALKVLRPELAAVIGAERFLNEIKVTANLQHPHILPLHDSGEAGSFLFYVMPYVEGDTLRDKLTREKQLDITEAIEITRSVASALDYAHRQGVIHRDIKPENVLIHDGQALVADFGIALAVSEASGKRLTETGLSIGTPHYMSPEQAMGDRELDARSDIYSVGAMLYEMLAGEPPYQGSSAQAVVAKVITEKAPPVTAARDTVPPHVAAAVAKALQKMPADRFKSASAFADALTNTAFALPSTMQRPGAEPVAAAMSKRSTLVVGAIAAVSTIAVFVIGRMTVSEADPPLARFVVPPPEGVTGYSNCCGPQQALSPDGEWLVFRGGGGGEGRSPMYRRRLGRLEAEVIPGTDRSTLPFFSYDGRWLGFHSDGRLRKAPMTGGPPVPIAEASQVDGASWGDNDVIVFAQGGDGLFTVPAAGGTPTLVPGTDSLILMHPAMLPGGEAALVRLGQTAADARMAVVDLATGRIDTLGFGTRVTYASGHLVFSGADGTLLAQPFDAKARRTTGSSVAILDGVRLAGPGMGEFAVSRNGGLAYQLGGGGAAETLMLSSASGNTAVTLPERGNLEDPTFSPDGQRIALRFADVGENQDIWIFDRDQGTLFRLTVEGQYNGTPVWTKDGSRIVFESDRDGGENHLYWKPSDGSGTAERLLETDYRLLPGSWFPDGKTLAVMGVRDGSWDIGFLTIGDSAPQWAVQSEFDEWHAQVSPDGRWLAYTSDRSGEDQVYVEATDGGGGRYQVSTNGGFAPRWSPDGRVLYYADAGAGYVITAATVSTENGFRVTSRAARRENLTDRNGNVPNYDIHPSGDELLMIDQSGGASQGLPGIAWIQNWPRIIREMTAGR